MEVIKQDKQYLGKFTERYKKGHRIETKVDGDTFERGSGTLH